MNNNQEQESDDGYDSDLFENPEKASEFKCPICTCIAKDPIETEPCGHLYCKGCLQNHLNVNSVSDLNEHTQCPSCREPIQETSRSKFVERQILKLRVKCPNHGIGCSWKGDLNHYKPHLHTQCLFVTIACTHCNIIQYLRGKEAEHLQECTEYPVECELCKSKVKRKSITNHMETLCPSLLFSCPFECGMNLKQSVLSNHKDKECINRRINCLYRCYGCSIKPKYNDLKLHLSQHQVAHLELKVMYLERLAQCTELISVSNTTGLYPEISGLYEREQEPYLARPVWRNKNNNIYLIRYDDVLRGWVLDKKGFDRDIVALRIGKYPTATAKAVDPQYVLDLEQLFLSPDESVVDKSKEMVVEDSKCNEEKDDDDDKQPVEVKDKNKRGLFCDGVWRIKGNVENSRIKVKGYTEREFDLEWELASLAARMRRQRSGITTVTNANIANNEVIGCLCGKGLIKRDGNPYSSNNSQWNAICNVCESKVLSGTQFWHCSSKRTMQHLDGYDLCLSCGEARRQTMNLNTPTCGCGSKLVAMMSFTAYGAGVLCNVCRGSVNGVVWHCPKGYNKSHERGFDLCTNCGQSYVAKRAGLMSWWNK